MTVGLRILLAESFKAAAGDRCIILIEVHESCVSNSPCCLEGFFVVADLPIPLEHCDPNNTRNQRYQTDELLILFWMLVRLLLWAALCSLAWPGFVLSSALPVLCLT